MDNLQLIQIELTKRELMEKCMKDVKERGACILQGRDFVETYTKYIRHKLDAITETIRLLTINSEESLRTAKVLADAEGWSSQFTLYLIQLKVLKFE